MLQLTKNIIKIFCLTIIVILYGIPVDIAKISYYKNRNEKKFHNAQKNLGRKLTQILQMSGPTFIKLGQALSTRPDLTGDIISDQLSNLQDRIPPFDSDKAIATIETSFGTSIKNLYKHFEGKPHAAASIAQVHKATLHDGSIVAVKILRPNIEKKFESDLQLFQSIAKILNFVAGEYVKRLRFDEVIKTLRDIIQFELDLRFEAASAAQIRENLQNDSGVVIPEIVWHLCDARVLTTTWVNGIRVDDREALLAAGFNLEEIAQKLAVTFFNQAYRDGFFHADLHPGNIFVDKNGDIVLVDFGIIGILEKSDRRHIAQILHSFIERDYQRVSDIHFEAGYVPSNKDRILFSLACRSIGEPIIGLPANKISVGHLLKQLFAITKKFEMETQTQLLLLQKTMVTVEGVGISIYPDVNMWQLAEPWIREWADKEFGLLSQSKEHISSAQQVLKTLPQIVEESHNLILQMREKLESDKLHVHIEHKQKGQWAKILLAFAVGAILSAIINM